MIERRVTHARPRPHTQGIWISRLWPFFLYPFSAILVSLLATWIDARWLLLGLVAFWSLVQFPMMASVGFSTLAVCRILLGAGEGPAYPVTVHALYKWFPDAKRTLPPHGAQAIEERRENRRVSAEPRLDSLRRLASRRR